MSTIFILYILIYVFDLSVITDSAECKREFSVCIVNPLSPSAFREITQSSTCNKWILVVFVPRYRNCILRFPHVLFCLFLQPSTLQKLGYSRRKWKKTRSSKKQFCKDPPVILMLSRG